MVLFLFFEIISNLFFCYHSGHQKITKNILCIFLLVIEIYKIEEKKSSTTCTTLFEW